MYKIKYTERNNKIASEYETRCLLYLLSMRKDSDKISIFFVDCLNDLTGTNEDCNALWDTQAKGVRSLNPTKIGEALITLFENYISELNFIYSFLLIPKTNEGYLINETLKQYNYDNFLITKKTNLRNGLRHEYLRRNNLDETTPSLEEDIDDFLAKVIFVVADNKEKYIREIVQFRNKDSHTGTFYSSIFDEIRDKQSALKNINVEGVQINQPSDLIGYNKYLKSNEIKLMVLNRFVGTELFKNNSIPTTYITEVIGMDPQDISDLIQENNTKISRTLFNKNNKKSFWLLLENIIHSISKNPNGDIYLIYNNLNADLIKRNYTMDKNSVLFFISIIKNGITYDN